MIGTKMIKYSKMFVVGLFALCMVCQTVDVAKANNYKDSTFDFYYYADGSDTCINARPKEDNTATYVKSNAGTIQFKAAVAGTNALSRTTAINPNYCSGWQAIPTGSYRYISNTVYGKYSYAYLVMTVSQDNKNHWMSGKWSPDNISGRY